MPCGIMVAIRTGPSNPEIKTKTKTMPEKFEVRDTRNGLWHWVYDAVLRDPHLTPAEKLVYSALCTFSGCNDIRPSHKTIGDRAGLSQRITASAIKKLNEVGYISVENEGRKGQTNSYYLLKKPEGCNLCIGADLCKPKHEPMQTTTRTYANGAHKQYNQQDKEIDSIAPDKPARSKRKKTDPNEPMNLKQFVEWCDISPNRHIQIIGGWAEITQPDCRTLGQWQSFIKRNVRAGQSLAPFTDKQIQDAYAKIEYAQKNEGWLRKPTLETILKFLAP